MITIPSNEFTDLLNEISKKWQEEWRRNKIFEVEVKEQKKFFTTVAFPYPNSPPHLGHGRTYVTGDVYARYMRMKGYNVLFPMGFHFTGTPIITMQMTLPRETRNCWTSFKTFMRYLRRFYLSFRIHCLWPITSRKR